MESPTSVRLICLKVTTKLIDDWACKCGQRYGAMVVDLERQKPIALLPDRSKPTRRCKNSKQCDMMQVSSQRSAHEHRRVNSDLLLYAPHPCYRRPHTHTIFTGTSRGRRLHSTGARGHIRGSSNDAARW